MPCPTRRRRVSPLGLPYPPVEEPDGRPVLVGTPLLTDGPAGIALAGIVPIVAGALVAGAARRRFLASERAMRTGEPLPPPVLAVRMTTTVAVLALLGGPSIGVAVWLSSR